MICVEFNRSKNFTPKTIGEFKSVLSNLPSEYDDFDLFIGDDNCGFGCNLEIHIHEKQKQIVLLPP